MYTSLARSAFRSSAWVRSRSAQRSLRKSLLRATPDDNSTSSTSGTVFYGGKAYTLEEWKEAVESGSLARTATPVAVTANSDNSTSTLSFNDVMAFSGSAPEIVNGRLAMLGFVSAVAAEAASGEGVLRQWAEEPTGVALAFLLFVGGSLVTAFQPASKRAESRLGPFTPQAELVNGRAAMLGFAALLIIEAVKGSPLI